MSRVIPALDLSRRQHLLVARVIILWAALVPLVFGLGCVIDPRFAAVFSAFFAGAKGSISPEMDYILRPLGLYILMFGVLLVIAARDPVRYRLLLSYGGILFILRGIQRLTLTPKLLALYAIAPSVNAWHCAYLVLLGGLVLMARGRRPERPA